MPVTQILLTNANNGGYTPDGTYLYNNVATSWGSVSSPKPTYSSTFVFPNTSTGQRWTFNGSNNFQTTAGLGQWSAFDLNLWFYPTLAGRIIMTIQGQLTENSGYTHSALEVHSNLTVRGGFWNGSYVVPMASAETVTLNAWNHIYFRHSGTEALLKLNNQSLFTTPYAWSYPTDMVVGFGCISGTNMGNNGRYTGSIALVSLSNTVTGSNYDATKAIYGL